MRICTQILVMYSSDYLAVADRASSVIAQTSRDHEGHLPAIELANLQLLQLRTFDNHIDGLIDRAYSDTAYLSNPPPIPLLSGRGLSKTLADIAEMRIEIAGVLDKVVNVTKFLGDYTLARLYEYLSSRLHLKEWQETVSGKLEILEDIYQMASDKVSSRHMFIPELLIVLLFIFEALVTISHLLR